MTVIHALPVSKMGFMENGSNTMCHSPRRGREFSSHSTWARTSHLCFSLSLGLSYFCPFCITSGLLGTGTLKSHPSSFSLSNLKTFFLSTQAGLLRKGMLAKCVEVTALVFFWGKRLSERAWLRSRPALFLTSDVSDHRGGDGDSFCFLVFIFLRKFITNHKDCQQGLALQPFQ